MYIGVLNGTLQARDLASGALLWEFRTDASRRNAGWVLTGDGAFNGALHYADPWREAPLAAAVRQSGVGSLKAPRMRGLSASPDRRSSSASASSRPSRPK